MVANPSSASIPERRSFLGKVIGVIGAAIAGFVGVAGTRFALHPALKTQPENASWYVVGPVDEVPQGQPVKRSIVVSQDAGWGRFNSQRLIWLIREGAQLTVFSATCPHLGCTINTTTQGFVCPCHGSAWDAAGKYLGGPAPRGMDTLEHRVEEGLVKVKYQFFKPGVEAKVVLS